jgi:hypothetical protein
VAAGFIDFEITWRAEVYADAPQESSAEDFGTLGINFFARKPLNEREREDYFARQMCEFPTSVEDA